MPPRGKQKITTRELPSKDGDAPGEPKRPSDDAPKLVSSLSCCESGATTQRKSPHHKHDDDVSKIQRASDAEPKSSCRNSTGHERALDQQSDADVDASETSDAYHLPTMLKYRVTSQAAKTPEFTFRKEPSDIDKLVMAIGSLTTSMNESHESKLKFHKDERKNRESDRKLLSELCEITKMQASEACQHEQSILNGIEAMGNNITKAIGSEIQAMSARVDILNQVSLDAIMK
jgi:hypothetical protein